MPIQSPWLPLLSAPCMPFCVLKPSDNDGRAGSLRAALDAIVMENKKIDGLEEEVKRVCCEHGVVLSVAQSRRTPDKTRKAVMVLKCRHGMINRQAYWQARRNGEMVYPSCVAQEAMQRSLKIPDVNTCPR